MLGFFGIECQFHPPLTQESMSTQRAAGMKDLLHADTAEGRFRDIKLLQNSKGSE